MASCSRSDELLLGCGVAHTVERRLAVRQAQVRISARHPRGGPLPSGSHEENKRVRYSTSSIYINIVCLLDVKINEKSGSMPPKL
jgi:hypothetical protein